MMPQRLQRQRTRGWRMPPGAVYVGRPGPFGNPFPAGAHGRERAVALFSRWLLGNMSAVEARDLLTYPMQESMVAYRRAMREAMPSLRGKDLVCWCPCGAPCHADVLIELVNGERA